MSVSLAREEIVSCLPLSRRCREPQVYENCKRETTEQHKPSNSKAFFSPTNHTQNYGYENQETLRDLIYKITYFKDPIKRPANQGAKK